MSIPEHLRPTVCRVNQLSEILEDPFFLSPHPLADTWCDFDGVGNHAFAREADPGKWFALHAIASHSRSVHFVTLRYPLHNGILTKETGVISPPYHRLHYHMPFFPDELQERIRKVLTFQNSSCSVEFHLGLGKLLNPFSMGKLSKQVCADLSENIPVLILGSGQVDRRRWTKLTKNLLRKGVTDFSRLRYYDTGRLFV